jgi:hypothetical protein
MAFDEIPDPFLVGFGVLSERPADGLVNEKFICFGIMQNGLAEKFRIRLFFIL